MLLGVPNALHFNYQCQNCLTITNGLLINTMVITQAQGAAPGQYDLQYTCLVCGFSEHFNTALPSADVQLSGAHGTQTQLIRQLQTILLLQELG
jgi:hypothetical protein